MKRNDRNAATATINSATKASVKSNGHSTVTAEPVSADLRAILASLQTMRDGDFSVRLPGSWTGLTGKIADTFNEIVAANQQMSRELQRVGQVVGKEGRTRERTRVHESRGAWGEIEDSVNTLVEDLLRPTTEVTRAIAAVADGNLTQTVRMDVDGRPLEGDFLRSAKIVNTMIQQLGVFTSEVTRVAREVGTDGRLGGQAQVPGVAGTWKDLTESVNMLAGNLTSQVRNIALVTTAVANGELSRKITVPARGEIRELKSTVNAMVDQLRAFTAEVIRVTREVGAEGKLGGQANVPGVAGSWKDLTDSINEMIVDLRESTQANEAQDWLNTNLARLSGLLQGRRSLEELGRIVLGDLAPQISAQYAALFVAEGDPGNAPSLRRISAYGHPGNGASERFAAGEGL